MLPFFTETIFNFFMLWNAELPFLCPLHCFRFGIVPLQKMFRSTTYIHVTSCPIFSHCTSALGYLTCYNVFRVFTTDQNIGYCNFSSVALLEELVYYVYYSTSITKEAGSLCQIANIVSCIQMARDLRAIQ